MSQPSPGAAPPAEKKAPGARRLLRPLPLALLLFVGSLLLVGLATGTSDHPAEGEGSAPPRLPVTVLAAVYEPGYTLRRELVGRVEARRGSEVGFELAGRLDSVLVDEGDVVRRREPLARLDTQRLDARRRELEARLEQARAALDLAQATVHRVAEARQLDAVSPQDLDEAETAVRARRAETRHARAALESLDVELAKSRLTAPFDAVVTTRRADEGQVVTAGQPILALLERRAPEARVALPGELAKSLRPGQRHRLSIAGRTLWGTVRTVLPVRERGTRSLDALFTLDAELGTETQSQGHDGTPLSSGELVRLALERRVESPGFWLPISALTEGSRGLWAIYVVSRPESTPARSGNPWGILERRPVEVLHQETDRAFVRGALGPADRIVADGLHRLTPGQEVVISSVDAGAHLGTPKAIEGTTEMPRSAVTRNAS